MPEFSVSGSPVKLHARNSGSNLIARFYQRTVPMMRLGQKVFDATESQDWIELRHAGENLNVIDRPVRELVPSAKHPDTQARLKVIL
jgi:hypothetical protein